jgi:hypothetical protein
MHLSRVASSSLRNQQPPNPLLKAILLSSECSNCGRTQAQRRFSEISPQRHAQAAVAEARKDEDVPAVNVVERSGHTERRAGIAYRSTMQGMGRTAPPERQPHQQAGMNSYLFAQEARKKWQQNQRTHTTGQASAPSSGQSQWAVSPGNNYRTMNPRGGSPASGVLDGMLESILRPASAVAPSSAASSMFPPKTDSRPKLDFAARWASEVKSMDKDLSLSPRDAYTTKIRSSLGSNAMTMALRKMKRLVHESEVRRKLFQERYHERPGLKRKRLKMVRWRKRFAGDFKKICQRANKLAGQGW